MPMYEIALLNNFSFVADSRKEDLHKTNVMGGSFSNSISFVCEPAKSMKSIKIDPSNATALLSKMANLLKNFLILLYRHFCE